MSVICFYHIGDLDGKCSAAIVRLSHDQEVELVGIDYGWKFPWEKITKDTHVIMVDFCLEPFEDMLRLRREAKSFIWIDHHKTAIAEYESAKEGLFISDRISLSIDGRREIGTAGCELTWDHFRGGERPLAVKLLGRYDVWDESAHGWHDEILPFQYGMRNQDNGPEAPLWIELLTPQYEDYESIAIQKIIEKGKIILAYEERQNELYVKVCSFETILAEPLVVGKPCRQLRVIACNKALANSKLFDSVWDPEKYDLMATFYLQKKGTWKVSLYTTRADVDCSAIAKARGGGGHQKAAGFICSRLPWTILGVPQSPQEAGKGVEGA